jgi:hypothetical protein
MCGGAELLDDGHLDVDGRQPVAGRAHVPDVLGPDADDHATFGATFGAAVAGERQAEPVKSMASPAISASTRFIDGDPMNAATKRFAGTR